MTPLRIRFPLEPVAQSRPRASLMVRTEALRSAILPGWRARELSRVVAAVRRVCAGSVHITEGRDSPAAVWKGNAQLLLRAALKRTSYVIPPPDLPLEVWLWFYFPWPKSYHRKRNPKGLELRARKPDGDNLEKAVLDACTGLLWEDDAQVAAWHGAKLMAPQGERGSVTIQVAEARLATDYVPHAFAHAELEGLSLVSAGR